MTVLAAMAVPGWVAPAVLAGAAAGALLLGPGPARLDRVTGRSRTTPAPGASQPLPGPPPSTGSAVMSGPGNRADGLAGRRNRGVGRTPRRDTAGRVWPVASALIGWAAAGPVAAGLAAVLSVVGTRNWRRRQVRAARTSERGRALEACAVLRSELRVGRDPAAALACAAAVASPGSALSDALTEAAAAGRFGSDVPAALERHAGRSAAPDLLRGLAACWRVSTGSGSGLAAAVERLEQGLRTAQSQRDAVEAELAGPRATAGLLALLPLAGTALAAGLGARPVHVLLHTPVGGACLALGVGLDLVGLWWTGRLVVGAGGEP